jgi:hypothetical protein
VTGDSSDMGGDNLIISILSNYVVPYIYKYVYINIPIDLTIDFLYERCYDCVLFFSLVPFFFFNLKKKN